MEYLIESIKSWYDNTNQNKNSIVQEQLILKKPDKYKNINSSNMKIKF